MPRYSSSGGMSAKEKRELIGIFLFVPGFFMAIIGAFQSYSDYTHFNSTQLVAKTITDVLAPDITVVGVGLFLLVVGLIIFFAESNKAATKGVKGLFRR